MSCQVSRRRFLAVFAALSAVGADPLIVAAQEAAGLDDPFLGQTTRGDLILAPRKTSAGTPLSHKLQFFGIVRKTNVLSDGASGDKINMLVLFAAFRSDDCRLTLCSMEALEGSTTLAARRAYRALVAVAQRVKSRPDLVYDIQDVDKLPPGSCQEQEEARAERGGAKAT